MIIAEYNSSFGLRPVSVEYDPIFDRNKKHVSGMYFGASLTALSHLAEQNGYSLIEVGNTGINAFFIRNDLLNPEDIVLKPHNAFREYKFHADIYEWFVRKDLLNPEDVDKSTQYIQWKIISNLMVQ